MRSIVRTLRGESVDKDDAPERATRRVPPPPPARRVAPLQFFYDVAGELRKVTWPTREDVRRLTILVTAVSVAVGVFLGLLDLTFTEVVRLILSLGR